MVSIYDYHLRLEPCPRRGDFESGFAAAIHDPVWFLARQWQMGEHQGENAASPMWITHQVSTERLSPASDRPDWFPESTPAEAIVESEASDWWTMRRRLRAGAAVAAAAPALVHAHPELRFRSPPPPYTAFAGAWDGQALWEARARLGLAPAVFGNDASPFDGPRTWQSDQLQYELPIPTDASQVNVRDHHGGTVDWYSIDGGTPWEPGLPNDPFVSAGEIQPDQSALPTPLEYPGVPHSRWWQIEDSDHDAGGYAADSAHFPTALLVDLLYSHSDDWFVFPILASAGQIVAIQRLDVTDSFGQSYSSEEGLWPGLQPPQDWSLFRCRGMDPEFLINWQVAELPLEGPVIERVQFGVDEASNLVWAVERIVDGRDVEAAGLPAMDDDVQNPPFQPKAVSGDPLKPDSWRYVPGQGAVAYWHPYCFPAEDLQNDDTGRRLVQHGIADLSRERPVPLPRPRAAILQADPADPPKLHQLSPSAIPANGIEIQRRWMLARDMRGRPVLWMQRQRQPLRSPPARRLRFDVSVAEAPQ